MRQEPSRGVASLDVWWLRGSQALSLCLEAPDPDIQEGYADTPSHKKGTPEFFRIDREAVLLFSEDKNGG